MSSGGGNPKLRQNIRVHSYKKKLAPSSSHSKIDLLGPIFGGSQGSGTSGGSRKFWWGGFEAQNLKNSDVFTKIESDFSAEIGNSNVFFAQIQVVSKKQKNKKKKKKVFTKIESDFSAEIGNSNVFFAQIQVVSKEKEKKKKKRSSPKLRLIFRRIGYV